MRKILQEVEKGLESDAQEIKTLKFRMAYLEARQAGGAADQELLRRLQKLEATLAKDRRDYETGLKELRTLVESKAPAEVHDPHLQERLKELRALLASEANVAGGPWDFRRALAPDPSRAVPLPTDAKLSLRIRCIERAKPKTPTYLRFVLEHEAARAVRVTQAEVVVLDERGAELDRFKLEVRPDRKGAVTLFEVFVGGLAASDRWTRHLDSDNCAFRVSLCVDGARHSTNLCRLAAVQE